MMCGGVSVLGHACVGQFTENTHKNPVYKTQLGTELILHKPQIQHLKKYMGFPLVTIFPQIVIYHIKAHTLTVKSENNW